MHLKLFETVTIKKWSKNLHTGVRSNTLPTGLMILGNFSHYQGLNSMYLNHTYSLYHAPSWKVVTRLEVWGVGSEEDDSCNEAHMN